MRQVACILVIVLGLVACKACKSTPEEKLSEDSTAAADSTADVGTDTSSPRDTTVAVDTNQLDLMQVEFGLETRPANPSCVAPDRPPSGSTVKLEQVFGSLSFTSPLWLEQAPGEPGFFYLLEQEGRLMRFENRTDVTQSTVAIDIQGRVRSGGERGLLGVAFHPDFAQNGQLFLSYTANGGNGLESRISRFSTSNGGVTFDDTSEVILYRTDQPAANHNGGQISFGPDGLLYIGLGDGGGADDQYANGQNKDTPLGAILRIDVDGGTPYGIPSDNPFASGGGVEEIFAWGLRNPWRFSFDSATGELWAGDVGQNAYEEIDKIELGGNYGWNTKEGTHCFPPSVQNCDESGLIEPVIDYAQGGNGRSITGGYVYNGDVIPGFKGTYIFGDFTTGVIWRIVYDPVTTAASIERILETGLNIASFAQDVSGELYVISYDGRLFKLVPDQPGGADTFPKLLSETGCFETSDVSRVVAGAIPYSLNVPFWSDGASKDRYFAIPDGAQIGVTAEGDWDLPNGSVVIKHFRRGGTLFETRLMIRHNDGGWAGYTYVWKDDGSDADLLEGGLVKDVGGQPWVYPSRVECVSCHTSAAGFTLGLENAQLHRDSIYPGSLSAPQLATLEHIGMFSSPLNVAGITAFPDTNDTTVSLDERARAYLHSNCAQCHRAGGPTPTPLELRYGTALADTRLCDIAQAGDMGLGSGARNLAPGAAASSVMSNRIHRRDAFAMPPLGSRLVDDTGGLLINDWINSLSTCP